MFLKDEWFETARKIKMVDEFSVSIHLYRF
jgi:hypothetical protein